MLKALLLTAAALLVLGILTLLARKLSPPADKRVRPNTPRTTPPSVEGDDDATLAGPPPVQRTRHLISPAEADFYRTLASVVSGRSTIFVQVPLHKLIEVIPNTPARQSWHNKIDRKTIDFVLCDPHTLAPQLAIELDDRTHQQANRKDRDAFVEEALAAAGFPLLRVPQRAKYDTVPLENDIRTHIRKRGTANA